MKKYDKKDHKLLGIWAADCAKRVLPYFERAYPKDKRPREAIKSLRKWARTGIFSMKDVRKASLDAHVAARKAKKNKAACFAARAAGQAAAVPHVPEHAFGPSYYALKMSPDVDAVKEFKWQLKRLPKHLKKDFLAWRAKHLPSNSKKVQ